MTAWRSKKLWTWFPFSSGLKSRFHQLALLILSLEAEWSSLLLAGVGHEIKLSLGLKPRFSHWYSCCWSGDLLLLGAVPQGRRRRIDASWPHPWFLISAYAANVGRRATITTNVSPHYIPTKLPFSQPFAQRTGFSLPLSLPAEYSGLCSF